MSDASKTIPDAIRVRFLTPRKCGCCRVKPGEAHVPGCDIERCAICGHQAITCDCIYLVNGLSPDRLEEDHPEIYVGGATDEMCEKYDAIVLRDYGGPAKWEGWFPGTLECVERGWYSRSVDDEGKPAKWGKGATAWQRCGPDDAGAGPNLNRLENSTWNPKTKRYEP